MYQDDDQAAYNSILQQIEEKKVNYDQSLESATFYELKKLRADIIALEKELEVLSKNLGKES